MFKKPHMTMAEQLYSIMTGETWVMDTDFVNCQIELQDTGLLVRTPDGRSFEIKLLQHQNGGNHHEET